MILSSRCCSTAVIVANREGSDSEIASLTVLDRLVVSLSRAGIIRLIVVAETPPMLSRSAAMGLPVVLTGQLPVLAGPVLVASGNVLATVPDLERMIRNGGRLVSREGQRLPIGLIEGLSKDWQVRLDRAPDVRAEDVAALVTPSSADGIEEAFWASLTSSSDGWVDRHFNRPAGRLLSKRLAGTGISPNQVSVASVLVGLAAAWLFTEGTAGAAIAGAFTLQASAILDCVDGDLARALCRQSALGRWLDIVGDQVVHVALFLGIGIGLWRSGSAAPVLALGCVAALGVVLSFIVVLRTLLRPGLRGNGRLQKVIDATTNRDFSVLLILFALFDVLDWFLWIAAAGSHIFWLVAIGLQLQETRSAEEHAEIA